MQAQERDPELTRARLAGWLAPRLPGGAGGVEVGPLSSPEGLGFSNETHLFDATWGAGAVSGGTMDLATLMKPLLTAGDLRVIGDRDVLADVVDQRAQHQSTHARADLT